MGGTGYYNKVFQVIGTCTDSGEVQPDYGDACQQENLTEGFQTAASFLSPGGVICVADDFVVEPNTSFHLTKFTMHTLLLGGGLHNATINIRSAVDGAPGPILHSFVNKGPATEDYNGYWPFPGMPFDVVSVFITFSWENAPIELSEGNYFIEVIPTPYSTDFLTWEATSQPAIGFDSYSSFDMGATWEEHPGYNLVFSVEGYCDSTLDTQTHEQTTIKYFPNPVKDVLQFTTEEQIKNVTIYNMEGREIIGYTVSGNTIDMQRLATGIYMVKVQLDNGNSDVIKIVKE
ncbi:T9SS type A sorting domain-containing protein [Flavobacterium wongokense]|uniref:T9SS type A sorting domain-containing protein n=1 Tax=Flavobacterium wongokense TaxID=2910674 RepID=UPI001F35B9F9|nr:T9SS type A sorting domain-containing protein [Flavobacterium sp. WG47]MCF6133380.1 T9SS type A sorting domain-containing protein [Flavobacterium sp. WG47]